MKKLKLYIQLNGTVVRCDKLRSVSEVIALNFEDLIKADKEKTLPLVIAVEQSVLDQINKEVRRASCSQYMMRSVKIYLNQTVYGRHIVEIKNVEDLKQELETLKNKTEEPISKSE